MDNVKNSDFRQKMSDVIGKFAGSRFVRAIMQAGYSVIAFTIVGAFFLLLTVIPTTIQNKAFVSFWMSTIGRFNNWFQVLYSANMGILALIFAGVFAYSYAEIYEREEKISISPTIALCLFLMSMFITVPQLKWTNGTIQFVQSLKADSVIGGGIAVGAGAISRIGSAGIFTGLVVAWITVQIYRYVVKHHWSIKMPDSVPSGVTNSFNALIPAFMISLVVGGLNLILVLCGTDIYNVMFIPFSFMRYIADTWYGAFLQTFLTHFLWWFGIHGATIMGAFTSPIGLANLAANATTSAWHFAAGDAGNAFEVLGGSGATLGMELWMFFRAKSSQLKAISKVEIVPAFFNINEPILFGLPIIYNIQLVIPFICAPLASTAVAYIAIMTHIVPKIIAQQPWPTPIGLGGLIATASWKGAVLAFVCAIVAFLVWYPFIKHYDNKLYKKEQEVAAKEAAAK